MLTRLQRDELKAVADVAFKKAGGNQACALVSRITRHATFSDYVNINIEDRAVPLDVAVDVDTYAVSRGGEPWLIRAAAQLLGFMLVATPKASTMVVSDITALCKISTESAEAVAEFGMARVDGVVTADEARLVRRKIADAQIAFAELDAHLAMVEGVEQ